MHFVRFFLFSTYHPIALEASPKINLFSALVKPNRVKACARQGAPSGALRGRLRRAPLASRGGAGVASSPKQRTLWVQCTGIPGMTQPVCWSYQGLTLQFGVEAHFLTCAATIQHRLLVIKWDSVWHPTLSTVSSAKFRVYHEKASLIIMTYLSRAGRAPFVYIPGISVPVHQYQVLEM